VNDAQASIKINPNYVKSYIRLGGSYDALSQTELARQAFIKARTLEPTNKVALEWLTDNGDDEMPPPLQEDPTDERTAEQKASAAAAAKSGKKGPPTTTRITQKLPPGFVSGTIPSQPMSQYGQAPAAAATTPAPTAATATPAAAATVPVNACNFCKKEVIGQLVCSRCKKAKYCNTDCSRTHWKEHKKTCVPVQGK